MIDKVGFRNPVNLCPIGIMKPLIKNGVTGTGEIFTGYGNSVNCSWNLWRADFIMKLIANGKIKYFADSHQALGIGEEGGECQDNE